MVGLGLWRVRLRAPLSANPEQGRMGWNIFPAKKTPGRKEEIEDNCFEISNDSHVCPVGQLRLFLFWGGVRAKSFFHNVDLKVKKYSQPNIAVVPPGVVLLE